MTTGIDTHAHIFRRDLPMVPGRRYSPDYDATVPQYLANLDRHGLSHGVLIQPSFLGTDNSFIASAIAEHPDRLLGVAVVSGNISDDGLDTLVRAGFRGIRLNLVGKELEDYAASEWQSFFLRLAKRGLQIEIQRRFEDFAAFIPAMIASGATVVIDHFGLPTGGIDPAKPGHVALLELLASPQIWMKTSAIYRGPMTQDEAIRSLGMLREAARGIDRMVWGSDWPHTQHEAATDYDRQVAVLESLFPLVRERRQVLVDNAARLFSID